ncbi:hypothetical protein GCM10022215_28990 [Nocardioides fonticola]|uniref:Integral membrane protein n=1 Tax=Nocardioides fonticola TaxID=450363 RepID=A0ABP7XNL7_9ACTN
MSSYDPPTPPPPGGDGAAGGDVPPPPPPPPPSYGGATPPPPDYGNAAPPPPPPPGGAYPPPPGGGFPPPPAPGAYGAPTPGSGWDLGTAFSFGWNAFTKNAGPVIGAFVLGIVVYGVLVGLGTVLRLAVGDSLIAQLVGQGLSLGFYTIAGTIVGGLFAQAALPVADGQKFEFSRFTDFSKVGDLAVVGLISGAITLVGTILCFLPGIIAGYLLSYAAYFVVDQNLSGVDALKASFEFCKNNLGSTIVWWLLSSIVAGLGICLCGVGVLVTAPIALFGTVYTFRVLQGRPVVMPS